MKTIISITLLTIILLGCKLSKEVTATTYPKDLKGIVVTYNDSSVMPTRKGLYKPDTIHTKGFLYVDTAKGTVLNHGSYIEEPCPSSSTLPTNPGSYVVRSGTEDSHIDSHIDRQFRKNILFVTILFSIPTLTIIILNLTDKNRQNENINSIDSSTTNEL